MSSKSFLTAALAVMLAGCQQSGSRPDDPVGPVAPSSVASHGEEHPYHARFVWIVSSVDYAPPAGRCNDSSAYVVHATVAGLMTHSGRLTGTASHCIAGSGYRDGQFTLSTQNGDTLTGTYGNVDPQYGGYGRITLVNDNRTTFHDHFAFTGGSGRYAGASGGGIELGVLDGGLDDLLPGASIEFQQNGGIIYGPGHSGD